MESISVTRIKMKKASGIELLDAEDELAVEEPLEIELVYGNEKTRIHKVLSVTMRTPGNDEELALGFLFTEGIIQRRSQVEKWNSFSTENKVLVALRENEVPLLQKVERNFYTTSSCGVCGKASIEAIKTVSYYTNAPD